MSANVVKEATMYNDIITRIHHVTQTRTQVELAALLGVRQSSIADAKRRNSIPNNWYLVLFEKLGVSPDWLKNESGPMFLRGDAGYLPSNDSNSITPATFSDPLVRPVQRTIYAMHGHFPEPLSTEAEIQALLNPIGRIVLPETYSAASGLILEVDNEAMSPFIRKGAHVGIDTQARNPSGGEIFAVLMPHEGIILRRLFCETEGFILRAEEASRFPETRFPAEKLAGRLLGRLAWVLQAG